MCRHPCEPGGTVRTTAKSGIQSSFELLNYALRNIQRTTIHLQCNHNRTASTFCSHLSNIKKKNNPIIHTQQWSVKKVGGQTNATTRMISGMNLNRLCDFVYYELCHSTRTHVIIACISTKKLSAFSMHYSTTGMIQKFPLIFLSSILFSPKQTVIGRDQTQPMMET